METFETIKTTFENSGLSSILLERIVNEQIDSGIKLLKSIRQRYNTSRDSESPYNSEDEYIENAIKNQLYEIFNFINGFQMYGFNKKLILSKHTISLKLSNYIKQFSNDELNIINIDENSLLSYNKDILILGDPGSGKTTFLRRFLWNFLNSNTLSHPILIKISEIGNNENIFLKIGKILGLKIEEKRDNKGNIIYEDGNKLYTVDEKELNSLIIDILNENNFILLFDGLDEVKADIKDIIENNLYEILNKKNDCSKIILTNRSGNYLRTFPRLDIFEMQDLNDSQIDEVTFNFLENRDLSNTFIKQLNASTYKGTARKPLFLFNLLILFSESNNLPKKSIDVYNRLIQLLVYQWDKERGNINRVSIYGSNFDNLKKLEFLKELAFQLLFKQQNKEFSNLDLKLAFENINILEYGLTKNAQETVIKEIESHNGLVIKIGFDKYKFYHLTIQEFLCADYLNDSSVIKSNFDNYIKSYPEPIGVLVAIKKDSSDFFSSLISFYDKNELEGINEKFSIILYRALIENANFNYSIDLGFSLLYLFTCKNSATEDIYINFIKNNEYVKSSVLNALKFYKEDDYQFDGTKYKSFRLVSNPKIKINNLHFYHKIILPKSLFEI